jgi:hypothetical protein
MNILNQSFSFVSLCSFAATDGLDLSFLIRVISGWKLYGSTAGKLSPPAGQGGSTL